MHPSFRSLLDAPRVADAPERLWRDWVLVALGLVGAVVEVSLRNDVVWPAAALPVGVLIVIALPWRRTRSGLVTACAFGAIAFFDLLLLILADGTFGLYVSAVVLILLFALFRWGSGREILRAAPFAVAAFVGGMLTDYDGIGSVIFGIVILAVTAEAGLLVRGGVETRGVRIDQAKMRERHDLARELHDTVAHHVSAIAIQAQAGRFLASQDSLSGAADALEVIEEEASRTLAEMRTMIESLRDGDTPVAMTPQRGIGAIELLSAPNTGDAPEIEVSLSGDLERLPPSVEAAVYRMAQESITNAIRHARHATLIEVKVHGGIEDIELRVSDDGDRVTADSPATGFGLVGMGERAALLGGEMSAGPGPARGWVVEASVPRRARS